jgi:hypothetical protein
MVDKSKKLNFKKIEPGIWKPEKKGDELVGLLVGSDDSNKYDSKVYHLEVEGEDGKANQTVVFGTAVLDDRMRFVKPGQTVKIVYQGTEPNKKGQDTKMFDVLIADD